MKDSIKAVLLDYGGVVSRTGNSPVSQAIYDIDEIESNPELHDKFRAIIKQLSRGKTDESAISDLFVEYGYAIPENVEARWREIIDRLFFPEPLILKLVTDLQASGRKVALLSNVWPLSEKTFRANGWYEPFNELILSCLEGCAKPEREIYDLAIQKLGVPVHEILFVDDQKSNLVPATELGMQTLLALTPEQVDEDVRKNT